MFAGPSEPVVVARLAAPRSLWDASYTETSWITQFSTEGPIALLPLLSKHVAAHYPGTGVVLGEYYHGAGAHVSGEND